MAKLEKSAFNQTHVAILAAFPSENDLEMMLRFEMNEQLNTIAGGKNLSEIVFNLISWAEAHEKIEHLLRGALKQNRQNELLKECFIDFILSQNISNKSTLATEYQKKNVQEKLRTVANEQDPSKTDAILHTGVGEFSLMQRVETICSEYSPNSTRLLVWGIRHQQENPFDRLFGGGTSDQIECELVLTLIYTDGRNRCSYIFGGWQSDKGTSTLGMTANPTNWKIRWIDNTGIFVRVPKTVEINFPGPQPISNLSELSVLDDKSGEPSFLLPENSIPRKVGNAVSIPFGDYQFTTDDNNLIWKIDSY